MAIKKFNIQGLDRTANTYVLLNTDLANITLGNVYVTNIFDSNGNAYVSGGGGSASITVSSTAPNLPPSGALWLNDDSGEMYVYTGNVWIQPTGGVGPAGATGLHLTGANVSSGNLLITLSDSQVIDAGYVIGATGPMGPPGTGGGGGGANVIVSSNPPVTESEGSLWVDSDTGILSVFLGNAWISTSIPGANGINGDNGATGATGVNVSNVQVTSGNLVITYSNAQQFNVGSVIGPRGATGLMITTANISSGNLLVTLNDSSVINTGAVLGATGATGVTPSLALETANIIVAATGTVTHDYSIGAIFVHVGPVANFTANFTNVPTTNNVIVNFTLIVYQNATPYYPSAIQINSISQNVLWFDGTAPNPGPNKTEIYSFSLIRVSSVWRALGNYSTYS